MSLRKLHNQVKTNKLSLQEAMNQAYKLGSKKPLTEGTKRLDKVNFVIFDDSDIESKKFAAEYVKGMAGDYAPGGASNKQIIDGDNFWNKYDVKRISTRFGGAGESHYINKSTGEVFSVDKTANGKTFYGNNHYVKKIEKLNEISNKILGNYIRKASGGVDHEGSLVNIKKNSEEFYNNADIAGRSISGDSIRRSHYWGNKGEDSDRKYGKRQTGIVKALDKLSESVDKELTVEDINEILQMLKSIDDRLVNVEQNSKHTITIDKAAEYINLVRISLASVLRDKQGRSW